MTSKKDGTTIAHHHDASSSKNKIGHAVGVCRKCGTEGGHGIGGYANGINKRTFKKGPWTAEEDALLMEYVKKHGERHWNCVQRTGLMRCGKSCRLRWTNHLRPDLKKGTFSLEEERIVLELHAKLGNKWSKIAAQLPGRTDNEVKNFWNTKIKRRMKANLIAPNSDENHLKMDISLHQHLKTQIHPQKSLLVQQDLSSFTNTSVVYTSHCSIPSMFTSNVPPISSMIYNSSMEDPILSFLNNPAYKFHFIGTEEGVGNTDMDSVRLSFPSTVPRFALSRNAISIDGGSSNTTLVENYICGSAIAGCKEINYGQIFSTPTSGMSAPENGIWCIPSTTGKNLEVEKSTITEDGGDMIVVSGGKDIGAKRQFDDKHSNVTSSNGMKKFKRESLNELVCMDDDLSSLLFEFSSNGSPPPLCGITSDTSMHVIVNAKETSSNVPHNDTSTTPSSTISTSELNLNVDNHIWCNVSKTLMY